AQVPRVEELSTEETGNMFIRLNEQSVAWTNDLFAFTIKPTSVEENGFHTPMVYIRGAGCTDCVVYIRAHDNSACAYSEFTRPSLVSSK
ncbi:hypothetical protein CSKR_201433, partial [Clonorchis sinensis]